jgi:hypothetical protein
MGAALARICAVSFWTVQSQDGGDFSGLVSIGGNGRNSDRLCGYTGRFSGTIAADGAVTIRLDRLFHPGMFTHRGRRYFHWHDADRWLGFHRDERSGDLSE